MAQGSRLKSERLKPEPLLVLLDTAYNQTSWQHGPNLRGSLRGVSLDAAAWRPRPGAHNAWELLVHAAYWKYVVWRRLTGAAREIGNEGLVHQAETRLADLDAGAS